MMTRIAAAVVFGVASISSATATERTSRYASFDSAVAGTGSIDFAPQARSPFGCPIGSAAEGNADRQNVSVQHYGQTSGGPRC